MNLNRTDWTRNLLFAQSDSGRVVWFKSHHRHKRIPMPSSPIDRASDITTTPHEPSGFVREPTAFNLIHYISAFFEPRFAPIINVELSTILNDGPKFSSNVDRVSVIDSGMGRYTLGSFHTRGTSYALFPLNMDLVETDNTTNIIERSNDYPSIVLADAAHIEEDGNYIAADMDLYLIFFDPKSYGKDMDLCLPSRKDNPCLIQLNNYREVRKRDGQLVSRHYTDGQAAFSETYYIHDVDSLDYYRVYKINDINRVNVFSGDFFKDSQEELDFRIQQ